MNPAFGVVLFESVSATVRAEKEAKKDGLKVKLVPVPRQLSSDCGICMRFEWPDMERVQTLLSRKGLKSSGIQKA
jgi:hypothetical protein